VVLVRIGPSQFLECRYNNQGMQLMWMRLRQQYGGYDEDSDDGDDSDHGKTMKMNMKKKNMIMEIMNHNDLRMRMQDVHGDDED
jgi:hypothetical protein